MLDLNKPRWTCPQDLRDWCEAEEKEIDARLSDPELAWSEGDQLYERKMVLLARKIVLWDWEFRERRNSKRRKPRSETIAQRAARWGQEYLREQPRPSVRSFAKRVALRENAGSETVRRAVDNFLSGKQRAN